MKYFYSKEFDAFYIDSLFDNYSTNNSLPNDVIEVSENIFNQFSLNSKFGFKRYLDHSGNLTWVKIDKSIEDLSVEERIWRDAQLKNCDLEINKLEDIGTHETIISLWRKYRVNLRNWPENSNFPNKKFRPKLSMLKDI